MRDKIVLQISAGQGPKECAWVVANLYPLIIAAAKASGLKVELFKTLAFDKAMRRQSLIAADSYRSVQLKISGAQAQSSCQSWLGTVKWIGHSPYRAKHKRCNWFVAVEQVFTLVLHKFLAQKRFAASIAVFLSSYSIFLDIT